MALQINPGIGAPTGAQESGSQKATAPNGVPNQDAANQFADLLKQPAEPESKKAPSMPPFGSPFQSAARSTQTQSSAAQTTPDGTASSAALGTAARSPSDGVPTGTLDQAAANQLADLLKQADGQTAKQAPSMPSFGGASTSAPGSEQTQASMKQTASASELSQATRAQSSLTGTAPSADQAQGASANALDGGAPTEVPKSDAANKFAEMSKQPGEKATSQAPFASSASSSFPAAFSAEKSQSRAESAPPTATATTSTSAATTSTTAATPPPAAATTPTATSIATPKGDAAPLAAGAKPEGSSAEALQTGQASQPMQASQSAQALGASTQQAELPEHEKSSRSAGEATGALSDSQLAAAAGFQSVTGVMPNSSEVKGADATTQPSVDGEKINAMMNSVTKELGMRDLSQLKLGGEMTLKLDQGTLPNTEVKVRFEGNEMVITVDSQTNDVNSFCTDNLALLQQSVSAGMAEDMKVRVEIRNPPTDQPNQRRDEQSGGQSGGQGGSGQGQSGGSSGEQGRGEPDEQEGTRSS